MTEKANKIRLFSLCDHVGCSINEAGRNGATNTITALDITAYTGGRTMPVKGNIAILSPQTTENKSDTWQPIGAVAARLVEGGRK